MLNKSWLGFPISLLLEVVSKDTPTRKQFLGSVTVTEKRPKRGKNAPAHLNPLAPSIVT